MNDTPNHMLITMAKMNYLVESILIKFIVMDIFIFLLTEWKSVSEAESSIHLKCYEEII